MLTTLGRKEGSEANVARDTQRTRNTLPKGKLSVASCGRPQIKLRHPEEAPNALRIMRD